MGRVGGKSEREMCLELMTLRFWDERKEGREKEKKRRVVVFESIRVGATSRRDFARGEELVPLKPHVWSISTVGREEEGTTDTRGSSRLEKRKVERETSQRRHRLKGAERRNTG